MALQFSIDPATGVVKPPITVFNGGKRKNKNKNKTKSKTKRSKKSKQTMRRRR